MWDTILQTDVGVYIQKALNESQFAQGAVVIAVLGTIWGFIRSIPNRAWPRIRRLFFYSVVVEQSDELYELVYKYLSDTYGHKYSNVKASLTRFTTGKHGMIFFEEERKDGKSKVFLDNHDDYIKIWYKYRWITISSSREKMENADIANAYLGKAVISGYGAKRAINDLVEMCVGLKAKKKERTSYQYVSNNSQWYCRELPGTKSIANIFIDEKEELVQKIDDFVQSNEWYKKRGIPYKKGVLLHGPPGTGKTATAQAFAKHLKRHLYIVNLNGINNSQFVSLVNNMQIGSIVLMDDIDVCTPTRDTMSGAASREGVALNTLLSFLDGALSLDNMIVFATTNNIEALDPALIRKGRFDICKKLDFPSDENVSAYLSNFWDQPVKLPKPLNYGRSMVNIQTACLESTTATEAVEKIYEEAKTVPQPFKKPEVLDISGEDISVEDRYLQGALASDALIQDDTAELLSHTI